MVRDKIKNASEREKKPVIELWLFGHSSKGATLCCTQPSDGSLPSVKKTILLNLMEGEHGWKKLLVLESDRKTKGMKMTFTWHFN